MKISAKRSKITSILAFPIVLSIGIVLIPVAADYTDHRLAEQAVAQAGRWFTGHTLSAIGFCLSILAAGSINAHLRRRSGALPVLTLPFIAIGAGLYAAGLGADGIGPLAVRAAGYSPAIFFDGSGFWVTGIFIAGMIVFGFGLIKMVNGSIQQGLLTGRSRYICFVSTLLFMAAPTILSGWALYGVAAAGFGVFVPLASAMSRR